MNCEITSELETHYVDGTLSADTKTCAYFIPASKSCYSYQQDNGPEGGSYSVYVCSCNDVTESSQNYYYQDCRFTKSSILQEISCSPSPSPSRSNTPSQTPSNSPTSSNSGTPSNSGTSSNSGTPSTTISVSNTPTSSSTTTLTSTPTPSNTPAPRIDWQPFGPLYNYQLPIRIGDVEFTECFEKLEHGYQMCRIKKEEVDAQWFDCSIRLCLEVYPLEEHIESREVCIATITYYYEENVRQQGFIDEFKDIQTTVCISASNTPAAVPSQTQTPTARPTPTQTPTPTTTLTRTPSQTPSQTPSRSFSSSKTPTPSITPSPSPSPICMEWYCEHPDESLTGENPPRCVYSYEAQAGMRRLTDWYCNSWQYKVATDWNSCYDSCPSGMYAHSADMTCVWNCPDGYNSDSSYTCTVISGDDGGGASGSCQNGQIMYDNMCVDWCPSGTFADYNSLRCVTQCPEGTFGDSNYARCVDTCTEPYYGDPSSHQCVTQCPEFTSPEEGTRICKSSLVYYCISGEDILEGTICNRYSMAQKRPCCGNGVCEAEKGETFYTCRSDCPGTNYATLSWTSRWDGLLTAPQGYGYDADWSDAYNKFDFCLGSSCSVQLSDCASNWHSDANSVCDSYYVNQDREECGNSVHSIYSFTIMNSQAWNALSNAQSQNNCNGGGGGATCGDYFCDSMNGEDCNSCSQDCGDCMRRRLRS